jgi:putative transposase
MPGRTACVIPLSAAEKAQLEHVARAPSTPQQLALRARIILLAHAGLGVSEAAQQLGVWRKTVSTWRARWLASPAGQPVAARLCDAPRPGAPATLTPEQICAIVALACEPPAASGVPITHWSQSELARQAVRRGLVKTISQRSVGRILKRSRPPAASGADVAHPQA